MSHSDDDRIPPDGKAKPTLAAEATESSTDGPQTQPSASPTGSSSRELSEAELDKIVGGVSAGP